MDVSKILPLSEFINLPQPEYLWGGFVRKRALNIFWGHPGCGKSFVALGLGLAVAAGREDYLGEKIYGQLSVLHMTLEDPEADASRIIERDTETDWYAYCGDLSLFNELSNPQAFLALTEPYGLIIIDSYSAGSGLPNENDAALSQRVVNLLSAMCKSGTTIILIMHLNKEEQGGDSILRGRGSGVVAATASTVVRFDKKGSIYNITLPKNRTGQEGAVMTFKVKNDGPYRSTVERR